MEESEGFVRGTLEPGGFGHLQQMTFFLNTAVVTSDFSLLNKGTKYRIIANNLFLQFWT